MYKFGKLKIKSGKLIEINGDRILYIKDYGYHRVGLPAIINKVMSGSREFWCSHNITHRVNGPSSTWYFEYELCGRRIYINIGKLVI